MSDLYSKSGNRRLWEVISELQKLRNHDGVGRDEERRIKKAVTELDQARISIKSEGST